MSDQNEPRKTRREVLEEELIALRGEIDGLDKTEEPNDEQLARFEVALSEWDLKKAEHDKLAEREAAVEKVREAALNPANRERTDPPAVIVRTDPFEDVENIRAKVDHHGMVRMGDDEVLERAHRAFEDTKHRGVKESEIKALLERIDTIPGAAEHALIHGTPGYRSAYGEWFATQGQPVYSPEQAQAVQLARASMSTSGSAGGYMLPTLLDPTLIHTGTATKNPLRSISRIVEGTQNVWHGVSVGNVTTYWNAENAAFTDGTPTFANPSITAGKLTAFVTASYEIFEDSSAQAQLPGLIAESMSYAEGTAFVTGTASNNTPVGIIGAISGTSGDIVTCTTRATFTSASLVDVMALVNAIPSRYEDSSTWLANKAVFNIIKQMPAGSGATSSIWPDYMAAQGGPLLGSPTVASSDMTTTQTSGTLGLIVLGDFSQFVIYDRLGVTVEFVQNVFNSDALPTGTRGLVAHKRVGSNVTDLNAFRFLKT